MLYIPDREIYMSKNHDVMYHSLDKLCRIYLLHYPFNVLFVSIYILVIYLQLSVLLVFLPLVFLALLQYRHHHEQQRVHLPLQMPDAKLLGSPDLF